MSVIVVTGLVVALSPTTTHGEIDLPYVNTRIDNLEARQTNTENDVKSLQAATNTAPAEHVDVPAAPDPAIASAPAAQPIAPGSRPEYRSGCPSSPGLRSLHHLDSPDTARRLTDPSVRVPPEREHRDAVESPRCLSGMSGPLVRP